MRTLLSPSRALVFIGTLVLLTLITLMTLTPTMAVQANQLNVTANVDKNPVIAGESLQLTIRADQSLARNALTIPSDLGRLVLRNTSFQQSMSTINGQTQHVTEWRLTLLAREPGRTTIPSFVVADAQTSAIELEVLEPVDTGEAPDYFITLEVDTESPYVQQQVRAQLRLHFAMNPEGGGINFPDVEHLQIEQLGQDQQTQELIDGKRYLIITRNYALTPRRSGELTIPAIYFDGQIRRLPATGFSALGRIEQVSMSTRPISLMVKPRPSNWVGNWLPTPRLTLEEQWEPDNQTFTVGEPITRRITLTAAGLRSEQLPEVSVDYPHGLRVYPDRGQSEQVATRGTQLARIVYATAIVPAAPGEFELPEVRVPWWNTEADRAEVAVLPARTINVIEPPGGLTVPGSIVDPEPVQADPQELQPSLPEQPAEQVERASWWRWLAAAFAGLWLLTCALLVYFWRRTAATKKKTTSNQQIPVHAREPLQNLKQACMKNRASAARKALLVWHHSRTGKVAKGLSDVSRHLSDYEEHESLITAINTLEESLYSANKPDWNEGKVLWSAIQKLHQTGSKKAAQPKLPPLYRV